MAVDIPGLLLTGSTRPCRKIILHYHLFKNAGTSIDQILKENFGEERWRSEEFPGPTTNIPLVLSGRSNFQRVQDWLAEHPDVVVLSSHTAAMPLPDLPATRVFPIVMVRNPVIRLQSSYLFEREQFQSGRHTLTTKIAGQNDLAGYLRGLLELKKQSMARNYASVRLAAAVPGTPERLGQRTSEALKLLPFVGVVERFEQSMQVLEHLLKPHFPDFQTLPAWENATGLAGTPLQDRLDSIRTEIGDDLYREVLAANRVEIDLHTAASRKISTAAQKLSERSTGAMT